eukprot:419614_1
MSTSAETYGFYVSVIYFSIYGLIFVIASIQSAHEIYNETPKQKQSASSNHIEKQLSSPNSHDIEMKEMEEKQNTIDIDLTINNIHTKMSKTGFLKSWAKLLWKKKSIYLSLIPHLFDQATDIGVVYNYYEASKTNNSDENVNYSALFYCSLVVIAIHKIVSCSVIYSITNSVMDILLQFLDLMMVKAVYLNYKLKTNEPGSSQRFLQLIEGTFESGPQILISLIYIIKKNETDPLVLVSAISSLWTLTSRVNGDDKGIVKSKWKELEFSYKHCPIINWRYLFRCFARFIEITNRIVTFSMIWIAVGGFALGIILGFELLMASIICMQSGDIMVLGNLMYHYLGNLLVADNFGIQCCIFGKFFACFVYSILVSIFMIPFEASKVEDYHVRHKFVIENQIGLSLFIFMWITSILTPCFWCVLFNVVFDDVSASRGVEALAKSGQWKEIVNLIAFGLPKRKLLFHDKAGIGTIAHCLFANCKDYELFIGICQLLVDVDKDKEIWSKTNNSGELFVGSDAFKLQQIEYLYHVVRWLNVEVEVIDSINANINCMDKKQITSALERAVQLGFSGSNFIKYKDQNIKALMSLLYVDQFPMEAKGIFHGMVIDINLDGLTNQQTINILKHSVDLRLSAKYFMKYKGVNNKTLVQLLCIDTLAIGCNGILSEMVKSIDINSDGVIHQHELINVLKHSVDLRLSESNFIKYKEKNNKTIMQLLYNELPMCTKDILRIMAELIDINLDGMSKQQTSYILKKSVDLKLSGNNFKKYKEENSKAIMSLLHDDEFAMKCKGIFHEMVNSIDINFHGLTNDQIFNIFKLSVDFKLSAKNFMKYKNENNKTFVELLLGNDKLAMECKGILSEMVKSIDINLHDVTKQEANTILNRSIDLGLSVSNFMKYKEKNIIQIIALVFNGMFPKEGKKILVGMTHKNKALLHVKGFLNMTLLQAFANYDDLELLKQLKD